MFANNLALIDGLQVLDLVPEDVEVIAPELDHALIQLPLGVDGAIERRADEMIEDHALVHVVELRVVQRHRWERSRDVLLYRAIVDSGVIELLVEIARE